MSESLLETLDRARTARVDLGAFTAEELWRAGVPLPGVERNPAPTAADTLPGGTGTYRSLTKAPAPSLVAQVAESDETAGLHVTRLAELLEPHVAKVVEQRRGEDRYVLCLEPVELLVAEVLTDAGRAGAAVGRTTRFLCAFSNRFAWVETRSRFRRSAQWQLDVEPVPATDRVYLDLRIGAGAPAVVEHELSPAAGRLAPGWDPQPGLDGVATCLAGFAEALWDQFAPGPRPVSG